MSDKLDRPLDDDVILVEDDVVVVGLDEPLVVVEAGIDGVSVSVVERRLEPEVELS